MRSLMWLAGFSRQQKECKKCAVLFSFQGTIEAKEMPLTFHAEK
jgi:hypothetical protein